MGSWNIFFTVCVCSYAYCMLTMGNLNDKMYPSCIRDVSNSLVTVQQMVGVELGNKNVTLGCWSKKPSQMFWVPSRQTYKILSCDYGRLKKQHGCMQIGNTKRLNASKYQKCKSIGTKVGTQ